MIKPLIGTLLICAGVAWGNSCTASASGNWQAVTWAYCGSTYPHSTDSASWGSGVTITIPVSETDAASAITTTSTGALVVNGTLQYGGTVSLSSNTTVGAGATLTANASGAAWHQAAGTTLTINGTSASRVTINSGGAYQSGGFLGSSPAASDAGLIVATYVDFSNCGASGYGNYCVYCKPNSGTCSLQHITHTNSGKFGFGNPGGGGTILVNDVSLGLGTPLVDGNNSILDFGSPNTGLNDYWTTTVTTGSRIFENSSVIGSIALNTNGTPPYDMGLTRTNIFLYTVSGSASAWLVSATNGPDVCAIGECDNNFVYIANTTATPVQYTSSGTLRNWYFARSNESSGGTQSCGTVDNQPMPTRGNNTTRSNWVYETYNGSQGENYLFGGSPVSAASGLSADWTDTITGLVVPFDCAGGGVNLFVFTAELVNPSGCSPAGSGDYCPKVQLYNNTWPGNFISNTQGSGASGISAWATGVTMYTRLSDNIVHAKNSGTEAAISGDTASPSGPLVSGLIGWNGFYNTTIPPGGGAFGGTIPYAWTSTYSPQAGTTTGQGDNYSINPQFSDSTRNFLSYCKLLNSSDSTWQQCQAHVAANVGTSNPNPAYLPSNFIPDAWQYVRSGFTPKNATIGTMGSSGSYVGALPPVTGGSTVGGSATASGSGVVHQ